MRRCSFANGALGVIEATTCAYPGFPERIEITGERATAVLAGTRLEVLHHDGRVTEVAPDSSAGGTGADPMAFPHDYHRALLTDFLDALDQGREPAVNGEEALKVHRLIDAMLAASAANGPVRSGLIRSCPEHQPNAYGIAVCDGGCGERPIALGVGLDEQLTLPVGTD